MNDSMTHPLATQKSAFKVLAVGDSHLSVLGRVKSNTHSRTANAVSKRFNQDTGLRIAPIVWYKGDAAVPVCNGVI